MNQAPALPASSCRCFEIAGIVLFVLSILTGSVSLVTSGVVRNDDDYYVDDYIYNYVYPVDGTSLLLTTIAIPLLFCAARKYQKEREQLVSFGLAWMILSWVFFGISVLMLLVAVISQSPGLWFSLMLFAANVVALTCMLVYAEKSRKSKVNHREVRNDPPIAQQVFSTIEIRSSVPPAVPAYKDQTQSVVVDAPLAEVLEVENVQDHEYRPNNKHHPSRVLRDP